MDWDKEIDDPGQSFEPDVIVSLEAKEVLIGTLTGLRRPNQDVSWIADLDDVQVLRETGQKDVIEGPCSMWLPAQLQRKLAVMPLRTLVRIACKGKTHFTGRNGKAMTRWEYVVQAPQGTVMRQPGATPTEGEGYGFEDVPF